MHYIEYGNKNKEVIILLHGGGLSWWNYREVAKLLQNDYHVILPILDGHAGSNRPFTTIENNAKDLIRFIEEQLQTSVLLIGGVSLGGQILLEILSQRQNLCEFAIVESALVFPSKLTHSLLKPSIESSYSLIKYKWFSKLQFKYLRINNALFLDYYKDTCAITKENMIRFMQENVTYSLKDEIKKCNTKVHLFVGQKEISSIKKSATFINHAIKDSTLTLLPGMYHGEFSLNHPDAYVRHLLKIVNKDV